MFDWLEDLGEVVLDVGSDVVKAKHDQPETNATAKPTLVPATAPSAYAPTQSPIAVNSNGAPVQSVMPKVTQSNMLLLGSAGVLLVVLVLLMTKK